jgi:hypothetical protein
MLQWTGRARCPFNGHCSSHRPRARIRLRPQISHLQARQGT